MNYVFAKGSGGAGGIAFRMAIYADDSYEKHELGCQYISAGIDPNAGLLQVGRIDNGFAQMKGSKVALEKLPAAWQQKFNAAASGEQIAVTISVRDLSGRRTFVHLERRHRRFSGQGIWRAFVYEERFFHRFRGGNSFLPRFL